MSRPCKSGYYASKIVHAVRYGNRKLAGKLIETYSSYNFNDLHTQTLLNDHQPLKKFKPISVLKKGQMNCSITPIHTAAINPNVAYLKALMAVEPNFNVPDTQNWYTIHYAAVCEGTGPLKLLLDMGTPIVLLNKSKDLPLHCAARAGRAENVKLLLEAMQKAKEASRTNDEGPDAERSQAETDDERGDAPGPARKKPKIAKMKGNASMVNAKAQNGMTPLHMAAEKGHEEVVRVLLAESDINVDVQTAAGNKKLTPLMVACRMGFKNVADILIDEGGAVIERGDKLKRTALTHAVMNGQNHVVAMLLRRGASPCTPDSSGNTPAHYATAYGWLECLELLAKADPSCLGINNDWHLAPLAVAYLKGHVGIVEWLVGGPYSEEVTVNCCDQAGVSLVSSVINCYSYISSKDILTQLEYLALKGADCSLKDTAMNTPLHFFASKNAILRNDNGVRNDFDSDENNSRLTKEEYRKCFHLIVERGAGPFDKNEAGDCPFHIALKTGNLFLVECLLNKMCDEGLNLHSLEEKTSAKSNSGNILHSLLKLPFKVYENRSVWASRLGPTGGQYNIIPVLNKFISMDSTQMIAWLNEKDREGRTPLVLLCHKYTMTAADQQNSCCEEDRKNAYINFEQFLYTMCAVVRILATLNAEILLQRFERKAKGDGEEESDTYPQSELADSLDFADTCSALSDDDVVEVTEDVDKGAEKRAQHVNIITYGLMGNDVHHRVAASFSVRGKEYKIKNKLLTTIIEAAKESNILAKLLSERDANEYTPLLYAVNEGDVATSLYLMRQRVWIDNDTINRVYDERKKKYVPCHKTVLMFALEKQLFEVVQELNLTREQWNAVTINGSNAFHFVAQIVSSKTVEYFELLKEKSVEIKANAIGQYPLHVAVNAVRSGDTDVLTEPLEWLIQNGDGIHSSDSFGRLPLHYAFVGTDDDALRDTSTIDPIAVVSILEQAMDESKMDTADNLGNTPLHYAAQRGANICTVTLLRYGCDVNRVNNEGNTPLGIAVLHGNEACTLTLIQAKSNIVVQVISRGKPTTAKRENWIWIPKRSKAEVLVKKANVASLVVRNGWQGIIYVILDVIGKSETTLGELLRSALEHRKYNLAFTMLKTLNKAVHTGDAQSIARKVAVVNELNLFQVFVTNLKSATMDDNVTKVFEELLSAGIKWYSEDNDGILKSPSIEHLARHRHFELLNALKKWDAESPHPMGSLIVFTNGNENPLVGIVESWIHSGSSENSKNWLRTFAEKFDVNTLMLYERPAFDGMFPWMSHRPERRYCRMTPLIRAIQARCIPLVRFLLEEKELRTDVNQADEFGITPLMHACIVNSEPIVRLLFNPKCFDKRSGDRNIVSQPSTSAPLYGRRKRKAQPHTTNTCGSLFGGFVMNLSAVAPLESTSDNVDDNSLNVCFENNDKIKLASELDILRTVSGANQQNAFASGDFSDANFLHFMIRPCAWENVDLLYAICEGVPAVVEMISAPNSRGETPLMTAKRMCQSRMLQAMKKLSKTTNVEIEMPVVDISNIMVRHDVKADSERFLLRDAETRAEAARKDVSKTRRKPHKNSGYEQTGEICVTKFSGSDDEILYKVLLTKTDVTYGSYGFHNFYRMELIQRKGSELYILFTNWGRIGDYDGQYQRTPFSSLAEADKEFCTIFRSKTGNEFSNISNFQELPNKYRLVKVDPNAANNVSDLKIELDTPQTKENVKKDAVYSFIRDISNVRRLQEKTRTVWRSRLCVPFGRLSRTDILDARKILQKLNDLVREMTVTRKNNKGVDEILRIARAQARITNDFYRLIPLAGFENCSLPVIDSEMQVNEYAEVVENLLEFEIAARLVTAAAEMRSTVDPYLYILNAIECELVPMDSEDLMSQRILQYIQNSSDCRVRAIYSVKSKEATRLFNENALQKKDHRYLWHGTKPENILSILKLGLLATPASAIQTGQSFGKGIYFADIFAKSESYCTCSVNGLKYALLCQVALGNVVDGVNVAEENNIGYTGQKKTSYDTLQVVGLQYPDPLYDITLENGAVIPLGPIKQYSSQEFNNIYGYYNYVERSEYVVKDKTMTTVKYIVAFQ
uniref:Poly [ADP-ribose] polymerase n=1 Tax=Parascaris univalens TaxID=6257 RepID=A0A915B5E4_PARUN